MSRHDMAREVESWTYRARGFLDTDLAKDTLRALGLLRIHEHYRRVFFGDRDDIRASAAEVLADLAKEAGIGRTLSPFATEGEIRFREGQRMMFLHIMDRCDPDNETLARLARQMRENKQ